MATSIPSSIISARDSAKRRVCEGRSRVALTNSAVRGCSNLDTTLRLLANRTPRRDREMAGHLKTANTDNRYTKNGATTVRLLGLLLGLLLAPSGKLHAGSLDSTVIGMFPKDAGDIGYADLSAARELPWYPQFAAQVVPVSLFGFEQFLEAVQMRQTSAINEVAWASVSVKPARPMYRHPARPCRVMGSR